jgi:hypothetical protein
MACISDSIFISVSYIAISFYKRTQHARLSAQASIVIFLLFFF